MPKTKLRRYLAIWGYLDLRGSGKRLVDGSKRFRSVSLEHAQKQAEIYARSYMHSYPHSDGGWTDTVKPDWVICTRHYKRDPNFHKGVAYIQLCEDK